MSIFTNKKDQDMIQQLKLLLDKKTVELESAKQDLENLEVKQEITRNEVVESGRIVLKQLEKEMEDAMMKEMMESEKKAIRIIDEARKEAQRITGKAYNSKKEIEEEAESILEKARTEAKQMVEEMNYTKQRNERYCLMKSEEAQIEFNKNEKEGEDLLNESSRRANKIIEQAYKDKEQILNGLSDYDLFVQAERHDLTPDKLEHYITEYKNHYYLCKMDLSNVYMRELRDKKTAISIKTPVYVYTYREFETAPIAKLCLAHFDMLVDDIIQSSPKTGLEKSISKIFALKKRLENPFSSFYLEISSEYVDHKLDYLRTKYAYEEYKVRKKAELAHQREMEREEEKAQREYERAIRQAEKDEEKARRMIEEAQRKLQQETINEKKYNELQQQIKQLNAALEEAIQRGERAKSMAEQTRRGYVYIISNIGSFGENVFKIGLTRRLDPTERVDELSNASVPFPFDIHAIIESEDAPALESALHKSFDMYKLNKTNWRKEFFNVSLSEIERVVADSGIQATFIKEFPARQYRDSLFAKHCEQKEAKQ